VKLDRRGLRSNDGGTQGGVSSEFAESVSQANFSVVLADVTLIVQCPSHFLRLNSRLLQRSMRR
jgi:hypothetical protein